jgi:hypothetical protein
MRKLVGIVCAAAGITVAAVMVACGSSGQTCTGAGCDLLNGDGKNGSSGDHPGGSGTGVKPPGTPPGDPNKPAVCSNGLHTTLKGKVYDPAGANPLYGVSVYVPSGALAPLATGAACDACGEITPPPVASTRTDSNGEFELTDVPNGTAVSVVVQSGKWRRKIEVAVPNKCAENTVADHTLRLPKNGTEGDMPQIAVTAGGCDALECLLRGIGVDDAEFVAGANPKGHIHVFAGEGGKGVPGSPSASTSLWNDVTNMTPYDSVLLSCECSEYNENKGGNTTKPLSSAVHDYTEAGGRLIATHYHYTWLKNSVAADFQGIASWGGAAGGSDTYDVDMSTPTGSAFAQWLLGVNASMSLGKVQLTDVTDSLKSINPPAQPWIGQNASPRVFSFETPIGGPACGRFAFTDLHMSGISSGGQTFPTGCPAAGGLSAQQKALEFMLFELSSCK